ncbi:glycosyltransferase family 2 protein [Pontibacter sp. SGAir0037]|uniref:glycosyltransferase family 2 protein n=1 Tax=Pontibacter sp. SGAir0037 TaxID=2571030 RepID=UPI0010CD0F70|nr:glycosyltransferase family 2 protein [Pontibacter sp. SGAir0037]QCR21549.1 glycosyltransferase [Pontibacter sp. SGAir0037]
MKKLVSVVVPAYNEAANIWQISKAIDQVFECLPAYDYELIVVNDGSTDETMQVIGEIKALNPKFFYLEFSKNFGHQLAVKAGIDHAKGDCVISMDCDMQHPPEMIPELLAKWEEGYEVVYTIRKEDRRLSYTKRITSKMYYKFINSLADIGLESGSADFRLIDRKIANIMMNLQENEPFLRGLSRWVGFRQYGIKYDPAKRFAGKSKYTLKKMLRLALHGVTSFSIRPLYFAAYLGLTFSLLSLLYVPYVMYSLYTGSKVSGWASVIMTIVFFGGLQLCILGIIGIYIGKMFMQTKDRPNYIIRSTNITLYR